MKKSTKYLKIAMDFLVYALVLFLGCYLIPKIIVFFIPFVVGWVIALIANPLVRFLEKKVKILRKHSSAIIIVVVLGGIILGGYFAIVKIGDGITGLISNMPQIYSNLSKDFNNMGENLQGVYDRLPKDFQENIAVSLDSISDSFGAWISALGVPTVTAAGNFAKNLPSTLFNIIFTILSAYFIIAEKDKIVTKIKPMIPKSIQEKTSLVYSNLMKAVGGYFKAQFKIMGIVAVILLIGFLILNVNYAVLLALLIALLDFLPFFGTGTVLIPWAVFKLLSADYRMFIGLLIIYGVSQVVRQVIQPKILGDTIGLNPFLTLIFMYIGYKLGGVIGIIVAVPIGMILLNFYKAGVFDSCISNIKEIVKDINEFRKT